MLKSRSLEDDAGSFGKVNARSTHPEMTPGVSVGVPPRQYTQGARARFAKAIDPASLDPSLRPRCDKCGLILHDELCVACDQTGVGIELEKIIPSWLRSSACRCNEWIHKMNRWGPDGCETHADDIVRHLVRQSKKVVTERLVSDSVRARVARRWLRMAINRSRRDTPVS